MMTSPLRSHLYVPIHLNIVYAKYHFIYPNITDFIEGWGGGGHILRSKKPRLCRARVDHKAFSLIR